MLHHKRYVIVLFVKPLPGWNLLDTAGYKTKKIKMIVIEYYHNNTLHGILGLRSL